MEEKIPNALPSRSAPPDATPQYIVAPPAYPPTQPPSYPPTQAPVGQYHSATSYSEPQKPLMQPHYVPNYQYHSNPDASSYPQVTQYVVTSSGLPSGATILVQHDLVEICQRRVRSTTHVVLFVLLMCGLFILISGLTQYSGWTHSNCYVEVTVANLLVNQTSTLESGVVGYTYGADSNYPLSERNLSKFGDFMVASSSVVAALCLALCLCISYLMIRNQYHTHPRFVKFGCYISMFLGIAFVAASISALDGISDLNPANVGPTKAYASGTPWPGFWFYLCIVAGIMLILEGYVMILVHRRYQTALQNRLNSGVPLQPGSGCQIVYNPQ
eukprot:Sdes_comp18455_c0_seq1m8418